MIVSAGGRFHAFHLAEQLYRRGDLQRFLTTEPLRQHDQLPRDKITTFRFPEYVGYAWRKSHLDPIVPGNVIKDNLFDWWATRQIEACDLYVGFSNYSLGAFRKLESTQTKTIVDCGSPHIALVARLLSEEYARHGLSSSPVSNAEIEKQSTEYQAADYIAVGSEYARRSFVEMKVPSEKIVKVQYGVDPEHFVPCPKRDKVFRVLFVGLIGFVKGIQYLVPAWKRLGLPKDRAELCLVGPIQDAFRPILDQYKGWYKHLGALAHQELSQVFSQASVFVLPSVSDGFGLAAAEAMGCGLPAICTENTGIPDVIRDEQDGYVVPIRNPQRLAERLLYLYENPSVCAEMGKSAHRRIREFTWDAYGDKIVAEYKRILD